MTPLPCSSACVREFWSACVPHWRGDVAQCARELHAFVGPLSEVCLRGCALPLRPGLVLPDAGNATVVHADTEDGACVDDDLALVVLGDGGPRLVRGPVVRLDPGVATTEPPHPTLPAHVDALVDRLAPRRVALWGASRGCAFLQRVLIESRHPDLVAGICLRSHLARAQYHDGAFWVLNGTSGWRRTPTPRPRRLLFVTGDRDEVVTPSMGPGGALLGPDDSALAWAHAWGHGGPPRAWTRHGDAWSALDYGQVRAVRRHDAGHDVDAVDEMLAWSFLA
jgi:hypothetical protein